MRIPILALLALAAHAQTPPYAPQPILQGGIVLPLFPPDSPYLRKERIAEPEQYNLSQAVPGRINSIVNIHNPSIEFHPVDRGINTGAAVVLAAGGGHNTLSVGSEAADFVPFFYNYGVNTVIPRNRLRRDGYNPRPTRSGTRSRPSAWSARTPRSNVPPAFVVCGGSGDRVHAVWAIEYFNAMLAQSVPNIEMHIYGNGRHPGDPLPDGSRMTGGLTDRNHTPFGTWQFRFIDWFRDLGFLDKPGVETKAARDIEAYLAQPQTGR